MSAIVSKELIIKYEQIEFVVYGDFIPGYDLVRLGGIFEPGFPDDFEIETVRLVGSSADLTEVLLDGVYDHLKERAIKACQQ